MDSIAVVSAGPGAAPGPGDAFPGHSILAEVWAIDVRRWPGSTYLVQYEPRSFAALRGTTLAPTVGNLSQRVEDATVVPLAGIAFNDLPADGSWKRYYWNNVSTQWSVTLTASIHGSGWWVELNADPEGDESGAGLRSLVGSVEVDRVWRSPVTRRVLAWFSRLLMMPERR